MPPIQRRTTGRDIFVAAESFSTTLDGVPVAVVAGQTRVREGHPLLEGREQMFKRLTVHYDVDEAPGRAGEVRG